MRKYDMLCLSNAMTDIIVKATEEEISRYGLRKGFHNDKGSIDYGLFLKEMEKKERVIHTGGSPANVALNGASLGLKVGIIATVGDDSYGKAYVDYFKSRNIDTIIRTVEGPSGICHILVTPDGEKTIVADMGVGRNFDFDFDVLREARVFHTSGYELNTSPSLVIDAITHVKNNHGKVSYDLADPLVVKNKMPELEEMLCQIDILFMTNSEAKALFGASGDSILKDLSEFIPNIILKKGVDGSIVRKGDEEYSIPIFPVKVVNTNGAGDAYASGFLYSYLNNKPIRECAEFATKIAAKVCGIEEPHL